MIDRARTRLRRLDAWSGTHASTRIARRAVGGFLAHEGLQYAGSMAYFAVLSLFQLLVLAIVVGSYVLGEGEARQFVIDQVSRGTPLDADTVTGVIDGAIASRGSMTVIGFGFLVWGALGLFSALSTGIGRVFDNAPPRPFVKDKLIGLLLMALTGILAAGSLAIGIVTGVLQHAATDVLDRLPGGGGLIVWLIGLVVPILLIFVAFWVIYRVVPNRPVTWGEVLPGAIVAALLWTVLRFGFTWYATSVADYDSAFGPLSTGITLLVFLYFAGIVILIGAEVARAAALEDELDRVSAADPRFLPVPVVAPPGPAPAPKRRLPSLVLIGGGALLGALVGRLTKRDDD